MWDYRILVLSEENHNVKNINWVIECISLFTARISNIELNTLWQIPVTSLLEVQQKLICEIKWNSGAAFHIIHATHSPLDMFSHLSLFKCTVPWIRSVCWPGVYRYFFSHLFFYMKTKNVLPKYGHNLKCQQCTISRLFSHIF